MMNFMSAFSFRPYPITHRACTRIRGSRTTWIPSRIVGVRKRVGRLVLALGFAALTMPLYAANLVVEDAWTRSTAPLQPVAGAYMKLTSDTNATLVGVSSPVAGRVEVHMMKLQDGVMFMRPVEALSLPKGQTIELKPGGYHIMLMDLKEPFRVGDIVPLTLKIMAGNRIQTVNVRATVRDLMANRVERPR